MDLILTGNVRPQFNQVEQIVDECALELGGSATIFASQLGKLGMRVGVIGWVGRDGFGQVVIDQLQAACVDITRIRQHDSLKTGIGVLLSGKNDRAILTYVGTIDSAQPDDVEEALLSSCRHWHTASYFLMNAMRSFWPEWLRKCKAHGLTTSLDTNWDPDNRWEGVMDLLPLVDILLPNEAEAQAITGEQDVVKAGKILAGCGSLVVVKRGEKGAIALKGPNMWELQPNQRQACRIRSSIQRVLAITSMLASFVPTWEAKVSTIASNPVIAAQ